MKKVGYVQNEPKFGDVEGNLERVSLLLRDLEADLLVFPELFSTGYLFTSVRELEKLSEEISGGITIKFLERLSSELSCSIVAGFPEKAGKTFYNSAVAIKENGDIAGVYRKSHLFLDEKLLFSPGDTGFNVFNLSGMKVGIMICFDWIFPEACRVLALKGAEIIAHPANLVLPYAQTAMLARSIENRVFTITANRSGEDVSGEKRLKFTGMSQITSPKMEILARAPERGEHVAVVEIDPSEARNKKITERNDLWSDRRPELYGEITKGVS
ncbi:MAG: acyltransferase [Thermoproteota archaeon]|jgi:predicted amidohydrolase|uniref:Acyltransferase n=1 Tax=Candidatus Methanodesulfokora washburnensis TaxID=2478471 RepID=A0A3R9R6Z1_9CREN|nr:nitrilase-related carbon-nitrogen hydrolase [Candidatus Methanodesulfokores washburnensis]RSN76172.1 acyltransferase [Candidatus Methanodesulfokores washburnensis]RZN62675.1 MAG: acyltransferase [Candidatus Methanodesulfokores washburnensis]TDA41795.1 MAG: acyltransferase [Candidatus Korarchaeota archaeon]